MSEFALFRNGDQVSKPHSCITAVIIEAYEIGAVLDRFADFGSTPSRRVLAHGYDIRPLDQMEGKE